MTIVQPRKPGGFGEYLPAEQIEFDRLLSIVRSAYERYGFSPIDTPVLELTEVLLAKGGGETEQQVYSFKREGSKTDFTMRYDLTVPLARYVAEHESDLVFPFRRSHIGKVYRAERQQKGRYNEFYQCDIDVIGSKSPVVDAEFPAIINEIFSEFNFGEFTIRLNNRLVLNGFFEGIGLKDVSGDVLRTIDKMEKISRETLIEELAKIGLNEKQIEQVLAFTAISGSNDEIIDALKNTAIDAEITSEDYFEGIAKLETLIAALRVMNVPETRFHIDLKIARGLDYYTGTVYETILNDHPEIGSVCSGGRYDNLAGYYTKTELPGVGISIGLSRLFSALREIPGVLRTPQQSPANYVVIPLNDDQIPQAIEVAAALRADFFSTVLYTEPGKMSKKIRYADRMHFWKAIFIGEQEVARGVVTVKNMDSGESSEVATSELTEFLRK